MKYELTAETMQIKAGITLHRICALRNFRDVKAGDLGGWVENENNLCQEGTSWIYNNAKVYNHARVFDDARVCDNVEVYDDAKVGHNAWVFDDAKIYHNARVCRNALVGGRAQVLGEALVYGSVKVYGDAYITRLFSVNRSDGYTFALLPMVDGSMRISAGCRFFTFEEAWEHWTQTRGGTLLGNETMFILDYLERASVMFHFGSKEGNPK